MPDIYLYSSRLCPYCTRAKQLLTKKGQTFKEISVDGKPQVRQEMIQKSGRTSVPQIWINDTHIGGCDDLYALDATGKLDQLLSE